MGPTLSLHASNDTAFIRASRTFSGKREKALTTSVSAVLPLGRHVGRIFA